MRKLLIIHFNPIELYPPVLNWLNFLASQEKQELQVSVFSMRPWGKKDLFVTASPRIRIFRPGSVKKNKVSAYLNYLTFYAAASLKLIRWKPDLLLYYETLSSLPAILYKKYINRNSRLFIHYHEYTSGKEYEQGSPLLRWAHKSEKKIYPLAEWISQTNADRVRFFLQDNSWIDKNTLYALANYPSKSWKRDGHRRDAVILPVKMVYVGALSLDTMFTREFAEWVELQAGKVHWDIFSDNITEEARNYLDSLNNGLIRFREAVNYQTLPDILRNYDVGIILYNGHIPNYVFNAPNKLFEYLACGLDVWFPDVMKGSLTFVQKDSHPKVLSFDFQHLNGLDLSSALDREGLPYKPSAYYCEEELRKLFIAMDRP